MIGAARIILSLPGHSSLDEDMNAQIERLNIALQKLPNKGKPILWKPPQSEESLVAEYRDILREPDPGHRHWSGLWQLFPGKQFAPQTMTASSASTYSASATSSTILQAAERTVHHKLEEGGGHTGRSKTTYPAHDSFPAKVGPKVGRPIFGLGCSEVTQHSVL